MKKAISLLLSILMIAVGVVPAMATETDEIHEIFSVSDEELFSDTFGVSAAIYSRNNVSNNGVIYDYNVTLEEDGTYSASMEFDVVINGTAHRATAFGTLDAVELDNGSIYLSGPLDGTIEVGNNEYKIIVGFQTEYGSDEISAGITLENNDVLHFAFGNYEMPDEIYSEYQENSAEPKVSHNSELNRAATGSGGVNILRVDYNRSQRQFSASVKSDAAALLTDSFYSTSRVYKVWLDFYGTSTDSRLGDFLSGPKQTENNKLASYVVAAITDLIDLGFSSNDITLPTSLTYEVLKEILSGPNVSFDIDDPYGQYKGIAADVSSGNFDTNPFCASIHVYTNSTQSGYRSFKATSDIRYVCTHIKAIYYIDTDSVSQIRSLYIDA
ncbi:MAG: hypothetical protein IJ283_07840 [Oscillospiraceae bacterium]|nr:hypothetical protein [Oscillospiraceae bacterium]